MGDWNRTGTLRSGAGSLMGWRHLGGSVPPRPGHDEHLLDDQWCACGSPIVYRRRFVMGEGGTEMTFAAWCQANPDHVLPEAMLREIAELRSELGP